MEIKENASIVIAGSWNLSILKPTWFDKEFPQLKIGGKEVPIEVDLTIGSLRFVAQKIKINPSPNKLIFFSDVDDDKNYDLISEIAAGTVKKLHYTPIIAVGHNVSYITDDTFVLFDECELDKYEKFYQETASAITSNFQEIKHTLAYEDYVLNLTYNINRQRNYISFNYNYTKSNNDKIIKYIRDFKKNIGNSKTMFSKLVKKNAS